MHAFLRKNLLPLTVKDVKAMAETLVLSHLMHSTHNRAVTFRHPSETDVSNRCADAAKAAKRMTSSAHSQVWAWHNHTPLSPTTHHSELRPRWLNEPPMCARSASASCARTHICIHPCIYRSRTCSGGHFACEVSTILEVSEVLQHRNMLAQRQCSQQSGQHCFTGTQVTFSQPRT